MFLKNCYSFLLYDISQLWFVFQSHTGAKRNTVLWIPCISTESTLVFFCTKSTYLYQFSSFSVTNSERIGINLRFIPLRCPLFSSIAVIILTYLMPSLLQCFFNVRADTILGGFSNIFDCFYNWFKTSCVSINCTGYNCTNLLKVSIIRNTYILITFWRSLTWLTWRTLSDIILFNRMKIFFFLILFSFGQDTMNTIAHYILRFNLTVYFRKPIITLNNLFGFIGRKMTFLVSLPNYTFLH